MKTKERFRSRMALFSWLKVVAAYLNCRYFDTTGGCNLGLFSGKGARKQNPKSEYRNRNKHSSRINLKMGWIQNFTNLGSLGSVKRPNELRARWHELLRRQGSRRRRDELGADWIANRLANNLVRLRSQLAPLMAETRAN
jgi:hypothetical protein